ncbi:MAG: SH3 domain-containing protein [Anaerolineae bacterium]|nr:SH3 domain-containing protein [Anaerolineae bacterium]
MADVTRTQERTPTPFTPPIDCPGAPPSRLAIGGAGGTVGHGRGVYERPGGRLMRTLLESSPFLVEGGPECVNRQVWWQIRTRNGIVGWISEGMVGDYFAEACPLSAVGAYELSCPAANPSRLRTDQSHLMSWIRGLRMRAEPGLSAPQLDSLAYREVVDVIGGPACADGLIWWNVRVPDRGSSGWIAEASLENWLTIPEPWLACTGE